jgi:flagellar basal-body rod protein FlgF
MVSGKYSALAGAISREQSIANIANNLANVNTNGYRKTMVSFESVLRGAQQSSEAKGINYTRISKNFSDFEPGAIRQTNNPLDLAISGEGFFKVQGPDDVLYTRRGDFKIDESGLLTTSNGFPVLNNANETITIPDTDTKKISVGDDGTVYTLLPRDERDEISQIAVVDIEDTNQLKRESDTTFSLLDKNLESESENYRVLQGELELSNVNMTGELARMIDSYRTFETYHKVLKSYSTISELEEELGTLG